MTIHNQTKRDMDRCKHNLRLEESCKRTPINYSATEKCFIHTPVVCGWKMDTWMEDGSPWTNQNILALIGQGPNEAGMVSPHQYPMNTFLFFANCAQMMALRSYRSCPTAQVTDENGEDVVSDACIYIVNVDWSWDWITMLATFVVFWLSCFLKTHTTFCGAGRRTLLAAGVRVQCHFLWLCWRSRSEVLSPDLWIMVFL